MKSCDAELVNSIFGKVTCDRPQSLHCRRGGQLARDRPECLQTPRPLRLGEPTRDDGAMTLGFVGGQWIGLILAQYVHAERYSTLSARTAHVSVRQCNEVCGESLDDERRNRIASVFDPACEVFHGSCETNGSIEVKLNVEYVAQPVGATVLPVLNKPATVVHGRIKGITA